MTHRIAVTVAPGAPRRAGRHAAGILSAAYEQVRFPAIDPSARTPDLILTGGHVFTSDPARPQAGGVAIAGERIVAVGDGPAIERMAGPGTRRIDLAERLLVPGFQDGHIHSMMSGLARRYCQLPHFGGVEAYQREVAAWAAAHPDAPWIVGEGWAMSDFPAGNPPRGILDVVTGDRPAYLWSRDGHSVWANTRALALAGIDRTTPDPPDGWIVREEDGHPAGTLHEGAERLVTRLVPEEGPAELQQAIVDAQAELHAFGLTAWQEMSVDPAGLEAWLAVARRTDGQRLTARVVGALAMQRDAPGGGFDRLVEGRERAGGARGTGRFRATHVKLFQDGIVENFTAAMLDPYLDANGIPTTNRGKSVVPAEQLRNEVTRLDALGFHVHIHAIGDRGVRESLDAFEAARAANGPADRRHQIAHIQVIHPDDVPRFGALGVIPNAQPYWACREESQELLNIPFLGPERTTWQYPFGSLVRTGARLAMGSDWSVSTPNPLREMELAVTRVSDEDRGAEPFLPHERLDLATAIRAFTSGSAYANGLEADTGTVEVGKLADLALVDRDLFERDAGPIGEARVLLTLVGGEVVFEDPALG